MLRGFTRAGEENDGGKSTSHKIEKRGKAEIRGRGKGTGSRKWKKN